MSSLTERYKIWINGDHIEFSVGMSVENRMFPHFDESEAIKFQRIFKYSRIMVYTARRNAEDRTGQNEGTIWEGIINKGISAH